MYMKKENAVVVTKCLRIQHVPSNLRNCASYSKLHDGCVSLCTEYIRNTNSTLHNACMYQDVKSIKRTVTGHNYSPTFDVAV